MSTSWPLWRPMALRMILMNILFSIANRDEPWKRLLNRTTVTLGCNNVFGHDPPNANTRTNYADFTYDSTGRFVYVSLTKKF